MTPQERLLKITNLKEQIRAAEDKLEQAKAAKARAESKLEDLNQRRESLAAGIDWSGLDQLIDKAANKAKNLLQTLQEAVEAMDE